MTKTTYIEGFSGAGFKKLTNVPKTDNAVLYTLTNVFIVFVFGTSNLPVSLAYYS